MRLYGVKINKLGANNNTPFLPLPLWNQKHAIYSYITPNTHAPSTSLGFLSAQFKQEQFDFVSEFLQMAKKRKSDATPLDEVDRGMYTAFCGAANSLSQLYSQAINQQRLSFQTGERHAMVRFLLPYPLSVSFCVFHFCMCVCVCVDFVN